MCDDDEFARAEPRAIDVGRRQFVALGASVLASACGAGAAAPSPSVASAGAAPVASSAVRISAPDGVIDAWWVHPSAGAHPAVLLWPDVGGPREVFFAMARRLAAQGFAVLVTNPYYRGARAPVLERFAEWLTPEGKDKVAPLREALTPAAVSRDAGALLDWLSTRPEADPAARVGVMGFCMGGPFAVRSAAVRPERVGAVISLHGGGLVTEAPDSPHQLLAGTRAAYLFAIAQNDDAKQPTVKDALRASAAAAERPATIEVYPADHGWTVADSPAYEATQAERVWQQLTACLADALPAPR